MRLSKKRYEKQKHQIGIDHTLQFDTYLVLLLFVAFFRKAQRVSRTDRRWLRFHLFESRAPDAFRDENLRARYLETGELASSYTHYLDTLNGARRLEEIRNFHSLTYDAKKRHILALMNRPRSSESGD